MSYWQNKACVVTGGSAGLGLSIAHALAKRGARVMITARGQEQLEKAAAELSRDGGRVIAEPADVCWQEDVDRLAATVNERFGRLDFLCNCAGRSARSAILETSPEDFQQLLDVNFLATVRVTRALAPLLIGSRGHLVNIGSLASRIAAPYIGAYPASKFALAAYTQQLRLELGGRGLHVLLVCPGPIAREDSGQRYAAGKGVPAENLKPGGGARLKLVDPNGLAARILQACERRQAELVVPAKARLLFALSQLSPRFGDWYLRHSLGE
jgi:short-subunit dehydrogenase